MSEQQEGVPEKQNEQEEKFSAEEYCNEVRRQVRIEIGIVVGSHTVVVLLVIILMLGCSGVWPLVGFAAFCAYAALLYAAARRYLQKNPKDEKFWNEEILPHQGFDGYFKMLVLLPPKYIGQKIFGDKWLGW